MATEPVRQRRRARRLRVRIAARAQGADEERRPEGLLAGGAVDRHRAPRVIDEQFLAGEVTLAHRALQPLRPLPIPFAKGAVAQRRSAVGRVIFLP